MYERFRLMFPWVIVSLTTHLKTNSAWTVEHVASYLNGRLTLMPSVYWLHATVKVFSPKSGVSPRTKKDLGIKQLGFDNIDPQIHTHITVYVYIIIYTYRVIGNCRDIWHQTEIKKMTKWPWIKTQVPFCSHQNSWSTILDPAKQGKKPGFDPCTRGYPWQQYLIGGLEPWNFMTFQKQLGME